ncbi:MAG: glucose-6-phosphate isomerase [Desulfobulbaceae bacterium]|nr:glucose-6-phosphate isomerase [Desulfobulbaceae bacterium]
MNQHFPAPDQLPAWAALRSLAEHPLDLIDPAILTAERIQAYTCRAGEFKLLYATQRIDEQTLIQLQQLADQCQVIEQFRQMKQGAVMNQIANFASENRQVLHTASRDLFRPNPNHPEASEQARQECAKLKTFLGDLDSGRLTNAAGKPFTDLVNVGIGGSDLGPRATYLALKAYALDQRRIHFIANVDPDDAATVLRDLDLSRTLVNVVSKSGNTLETMTNEAMLRAAYQREGLDAGRHFLAVTGAGSPMDDPQRYLRTFHMFDYIGGRYSTTSMVGGVLLGFALGHDSFLEFLQGAQRIDQAAEEPDIRRNLPLLLALLGIWNRNFLGCATLAILPYSQALIRFVAHLQQCDMESNGKSINRQGDKVGYQTGPIVWGEPGTNGQHAFYQLLHQGTTIVPSEFIGFRQNQYGADLRVENSTSQEKLIANLLAQVLALAGGRTDANPNRNFPGNRPSSLLMAERLTPSAMGELLAIYENKIAFQGFIWNINSFDQEGVQLGKKLAVTLLDHLATPPESQGPDLEEGAPQALLRAVGVMPV